MWFARTRADQEDSFPLVILRLLLGLAGAVPHFGQ
jgi:hypothetical protein